MTTNTTPAGLTAVSEERLSKLRSYFAHVANTYEGSERAADVVAIIDELLRLRAGGWRPWKAGDPLPPYGRYACTFTHDPLTFDDEEPWVLWADSLNEGKSTDSFWWPKMGRGEVLVAYWSVPMPPPYKPNSPATEEEG